MSHKLIRVDWVRDMVMKDPEGQFYFAGDVDEYIEELHKRIEALEGVPEESAKEDITKKKLHYYCFSYIGTNLSDGNQCYATSYTGYSEKKITQVLIQNNREFAGVDSSAALLGATYLGYMTGEEMRKGDVTYE